MVINITSGELTALLKALNEGHLAPNKSYLKN